MKISKEEKGGRVLKAFRKAKTAWWREREREGGRNRERETSRDIFVRRLERENRDIRKEQVSKKNIQYARDRQIM